MRAPRSVALVAGGLAINAAFHPADVVRYGWWPFAVGPGRLNLFWTLLLPLDLGLMRCWYGGGAPGWSRPRC